MLFIIAEQASDRVLGYSWLMRIDLVNRYITLDIRLAPADQGQGYGRVACEVLSSYARQTLDLRKITLEMLTDNERVIQLYQKLGFRKVGRLTGYCLQDQHRRDVMLMERMLNS